MKKRADLQTGQKLMQSLQRLKHFQERPRMLFGSSGKVLGYSKKKSNEINGVNNMKSFKRIRALSWVLILFVVGCGGPPENNPLLEEAKSSYQQAEKDTLIVKKAPVALKEAEESLQESERLWKEKADQELVSHHAYIAKQKVAIARETAELNAAQDEVQRAEAERQRVLIKARKAEAIAAEKRAEKALSQAKKEREEAERARKRAEELAKRVNELEAQQTERGLVLTLGDVLFDFDKATLKPGGERAVNNLYKFLREYPERRVMIEGFTDTVGPADYNKQLSRRRADAVRQALLNKGIRSMRIQIRGYGEQYPVASNETEAGRQQNRRVEVIISEKDGRIEERGQ
jgi:outer membrane protein OmpA-like peptidoglycan-associated protein